MRYFAALAITGLGLLGGLFLFLNPGRVPAPNTETKLQISPVLWQKLQEILNPINDIEPQKPLASPPKIIKAIYATNWSAGSERKIGYLINLIKKTELNAIVIDIKDFSGYVAYQTRIDLVNKYKTSEKRILKPNALIKRLHDEGIYVIARVSVFQDLALIKARPDLAIQDKITGKVWRDDKKLTWLDPASKEVWDYNIAIAKDALNRGFDEINFDYIRFASDGKIENIKYPFYDGITPKQELIRQFFEYLRNQLGDAKISADIFGVALVMNDDQGIGQYFENILPYFDAIAPMVYPSHYSSGFFGFKKPATQPYEVVKKSLASAMERIANYESRITNGEIAKLRPWLQDFDLGAIYDTKKVRDQIQAVYDTLDENTYGGWMLWDPANNYTAEALITEQ